MGVMNHIIIIAVGLVVLKLYSFTKNPPLPELDLNPWWAPDNTRGKVDEAIRPFKINIPIADVLDLKTRLNLPLRVTPPLENANFTYGFNSDVLKTISKYWSAQYDWKKREQRLNAFSHFKTQIEGLEIHFLHVKPKVDESKYEVVPLLMIHGWPGSFVEFDEILPLLTSPREGSDVVFEVVCPSIPGYGFSQAASKQGLGTLQVSQMFMKLMKRLKIEKYYVQGGDWGSLIVSTMATLYPDQILGMHSNMPVFNTPGTNLRYFLGSILPSGFIMRKEDEPNLYPVSTLYGYLLKETGYLHLQATKPDTIGASLANSPSGLAAYILEKFSSWTHKGNPMKPDGGLLSKNFPISLDRLLDNVSLYWFTQTITSSMRFYAESFVPHMMSKIEQISTHVPAAFSAFAQELFSHPENLASHKYLNIVFYKKHNEGGHFAAMEVPSLLAADVHEFATIVRRRRKMIERGEF